MCSSAGARMRCPSRPRLAVLVAAFAATLVGLPAAPASAAQGGPPLLPALAGSGVQVHRGGGGEADVNVCAFALPRGFAHCDAHLRTDARAQRARPQRAGGARPFTLGDEGAYSPAYLQSAYNVASAAAADGGGAGQTVALVDAYDDPHVESDLSHYRSFFGLPACPAGSVSEAASGCVFEKIGQSGSRTSFPIANSGWSLEISLDVEMVSAICPKCQIVLVEANNNSYGSLGAAVNEAVKLGANVVSNSYGGEEFSEEPGASATYYEHPGVAIVASAGDEGYGVEFPAASRFVTAVGGTTLTQLADTGVRDGSESAWKGTGAGCSAYEAKPSWQQDSGCARRTVADVSAEANPETGVWVYDSYGYRFNAWHIVGGTSAASPIIGSFYALAGNAPGSGATLASSLYAAPGSLYDGACNR